MPSTSKTPLSDLMVLSHADESGCQFGWFIEEFRNARVGIIATGFPSGQTGTVVATGDHPLFISGGQMAGDRFLLAFADPDEFAIRFGRRFNAEICGELLIAAVLHDPDCEGIRINSAISETSIIIDRRTLEFVAGESKPATNPWWKFW